MNYRYVAKILGMFIGFVSLTMLFSLPWSIFYGEINMVRSFILSIIVGALCGSAMYLWGRHAHQEFFRREGLAVVALGWIFTAAVGALPFWFCADFPGGFIDAYFESMSGFSTTGSTVLVDIEAMPIGLLFWRSFIQWLGGMGIVVLFVAVLPALGVEAKHLYKVEVPGISKEGAKPRIRDAAGLLWKLYLGFTVLETLLLRLGGLSWFDSLCHTFTTLATGGFSTKNASIMHFQSLYVELVIILFMVLVGTNFALYIGAIRGRFRGFFKDTEYRYYLGITLGAWLLLFLCLAFQFEGIGLGDKLRQSLFQAVSIMTTTGYVSADFEVWPPFARMLLVMLMFVGGCAGSTGGSMKVIRVVVLAKTAKLAVQKFFFPRMVRSIKVGSHALPDETVLGVLGFFVIFAGTFVVGTLIMAALGLDIVTAATSVIATLGNIGPGLAGVGAVENFGHIPALGKLVLSLCMVLGRLELFTVMVMFLPNFWRE